MKTNLAKLWVSFTTKIFVQLEEIIKANILICRQQTIMSLFSKKAKNKVTENWANSNVMLDTKKVTMSVKA